MDFINAILLAVVEGITEFLPISSTGHLILVEQYLSFSDNGKFADAFMVIIQLPAILAVVVYFWKELWPWGKGQDTPRILRMWCKIVVAFLPAAVIGLLLHDYIEQLLGSVLVVALALMVGGVILVAIERRDHKVHVDDAENLSFKTAFFIGCFQCLAMIPGTSRSAATIIGAMLLGTSRVVAAEFSFFLAIPTMLGATTLTLVKQGLTFTGHQWALLAAGSGVSFVVAYGVVAGLMRFVQHHRFTLFGWYRIVLSAIVLAGLLMGFID